MVSSDTKNSMGRPSSAFQTSSGPQTPVRQLVASKEVAGQRIDNFLVTELKGLPKSRIYRIIRKGEVRINKGRIKPDYRLQAGDIIRIPPLRLGEEKPLPQIPAKVNETLLSQILYEDEGLIVLNKPSGMAVHGGSGVSFGVIEALRLLKPNLKNLELVHRLDRDTSGCLMIAKRRSTLKILHEFLRTGQVEKTYLALVKGKWQGGKCVDAPLQKNQLESGERMVKVNACGQSSQTEFQVLNKYKSSTLMLARPITGRTHQIRVHAQHVGNPIAMDNKYGDSDFNYLMKSVGLKRLFLHARSISFPNFNADHSEGCNRSSNRSSNRSGNRSNDCSDTIRIEAPLDPHLDHVLEFLKTESKPIELAGESAYV